MKLSVTRALVLGSLLFFVADVAKAQPLVDPYTFTMGPTVHLDTGLVVGPWDGPDPDRISVKNGHFVHEDGLPFRMVGTTVQYGGCFPDSATAIGLAERLRGLGINVVRFANFDYTRYRPISILADGTTTAGGGLDARQMASLDWFTYQLRQRGIRFGFSFQGSWMPREDDGIRQPDSAGSGGRMTVIFDPAIQRIHRDVIRLLLSHVNPHTKLAYKDDPALTFIMPLEDSPLTAYWLYTTDIVANNPTGARTVGREHQRWMDSTFYAFLKAKGYTSDAALKTAWSTIPSDPSEQIRNGGFEDPFESSWTLSVSTGDGAQALLQFTETDKVAGSQCARIRIGKVATSGNSGSINILQTLTKVERLHRYRLIINARTTEAKGSRAVRVVLYQNGFPYTGAGLDKQLELTGAWKKYQFDFTASSFDAGSIAMQIQMGADSGDVYLDEVSFKEVAADGLRPGESLVKGTLQRDVFSDPTVTPARMKSNAEFYVGAFTNLLESDKKLIRDTLKCKALLVPSSRSFSRLDQQAGMGYDFFSSTDWRASTASPLSELYGSYIINQTQTDYDTKPFVITHSAVNYPLPYQHELGITFPTYAGLHNWDGVFFSIFTDASKFASDKVDSTSNWNIFDKPCILTQIPVASNILRRFDVSPSPKVVQISQNQEALDYPPFHAQQSYSLSVYIDGRMGLFRRIELLSAIQPEESVSPQREISALSGNTIDPTTFDAENGQIFFDATRGILRTISPNYICVAGNLDGEIVTEPNIIVEQISGTPQTSIVINSLTDKPILESTSNLLVIGSRGQNRGTELAKDGTIALWGPGPYEMEGRSMRITLRAPGFDSCRIIPLGSDALAMNAGTVAARSQTGRFTLSINTAAEKTPWYRLEFSRVPSAVTEGADVQVVVAPNPATDFVLVRSDGELAVRCFDLLGNLVASCTGMNDLTINTIAWSQGSYVLEVSTKGKTYTQHLAVIR